MVKCAFEHCNEHRDNVRKEVYYCKSHQHRKDSYGDPAIFKNAAGKRFKEVDVGVFEPLAKQWQNKGCEIEWCNNAVSKGAGFKYCGTHYGRLRKYGNPLKLTFGSFKAVESEGGTIIQVDDDDWDDWAELVSSEEELQFTEEPKITKQEEKNQEIEERQLNKFRGKDPLDYRITVPFGGV